jgi:hypothetical protein
LKKNVFGYILADFLQTHLVTLISVHPFIWPDFVWSEKAKPVNYDGNFSSAGEAKSWQTTR